MQMLKKLFNSDNKYFLELDEIKESQPVQAVVETAEKVADIVKEKASEVAESQPVQKAAEKAKETADQAKDKSSAVATKIKSTEKSEEKAESAQPQAKSSQNGKATETTDQAKEQPVALENSGASSFDPPFWVAAMYNNNGNSSEESTKTEPTFATDNLMPTVTKYRRRPGGSLKKFKEMAKQAKTPKG
ncbi:hypothetical protein IQ255_00520 [Pleurocapsales cyanobacterium LEGE 10410]|nr:hypothetical protein [Pleurocapsales cyanobacterium LEGE 10410]